MKALTLAITLTLASSGVAHAAMDSIPGMSNMDRPAASKVVTHQGMGIVTAIDEKAGKVKIAHEPIAALNWPAMTMEFKVANSALLEQLKPGARVAFEIVERQPGEWVVTGVRPVGGSKADATAPAASAPAANPHAGH